jgi:hypothetical protein
MSQHLGRPLLDTEEVHHKNHNPLDNELNNLEVLTRDEHIALHKQEKQIYPDRKNCANCGAEFTVNPRKRKRHKCCSKECAQAMRVQAALKARGLA